MVNFYIYFAVIVSGASVLAIEILGTRILAPFYGASLYLWSALIGVTLAALSAGYAVGGRWADRGPTLPRFCSVIGIAGLWFIVIPWLRTPVLALTEPIGLRAAVLITATILFFPPLALLGTVSPYAIRLKAASLKVVGTTAGNLYAVSTVASVVAAIVTGFFLIPNVGIYRLVFLIGFFLVATSIIGLLLHRSARAAAIAPIVLIAGGIGVFQIAPAATANPDIGLVAIEQSPYAEIRVVDYQGLRYMVIDGGTHTIVDQATLESQFPYVHVMELATYFFDQPGNALLVGLGGGSVIKAFRKKGWHISAVEIDPVVVDIAYKYFGLVPGGAPVTIMDARKYMLTHDEKYEVIALDAFGSSSIPFHLVTSEAFGLVKSHLVEGGVLAMNIEAVGWKDIITRSIAATAMQQFTYVEVLPIAEPPNQLGNLIILASDRPLEIPDDLPVPNYRFSEDYDRVHAWDNRFEVDTTGVPILTDNLNPIDIWAERVNLVARRKLHEYFKNEELTW